MGEGTQVEVETGHARATVDWISKQQASCHNDDPASVSLKIAQRISCTLHRENARAILQRTVAGSAPPFPPSGWDEISDR